MSNNKFKSIDISALHLDSENPRLPFSMQGNSSQQDIIDWMLLEAATLELMIAIGQNDYFEGEQLLVVEDEINKGQYITIEGNRRLTAVKLLNNPELARVKKSSIKDLTESVKYKPSKVPCLIFSKKKDILKYLGFRHITGVKSWKLLEKARYLSVLMEQEFKSIPKRNAWIEMAKMIGSSSSYVKRLVIGYEIYDNIADEGFYLIDGLNDTRFHLNYIVDSLNKGNIRNFLKINLDSEKPLINLEKNHLKEITHWWFEKTEGKVRVIGDSDGLKKLNMVLGSEEGLKAFRSGEDLESALEYTDNINDSFRLEVVKSLKHIENADSISNRTNEFYDELEDDLRTIRKIALKIKDFKDKVQNSQDEF